MAYTYAININVVDIVGTRQSGSRNWGGRFLFSKQRKYCPTLSNLPLK